MIRHTDAERWYLAQLRPNGGKIAQRNLDRQGFTSCLPLRTATFRVRAQFRTVTKPLFPGYIFLKLSPWAGDWRRVNSTYGISRLVQFSDAPAPVPEGLVEMLRRGDEGRGGPSEPATFEDGQTVSIATGPFAEFLATVDRTDADQRVWLLLDLMGRATRVAVDPSHLRSV